MRMPRWLAIGAVWVLELMLVFAVAEAAAVFLLPPPLTFYDPQMRMQPSPRRIYDHVPNQRAFTIDHPFATNSMGFREDRDVASKKDGEIRILSIGDSLAVGLGVRREDTYANLLEESLKRRALAVRVINAGVACYATWQEVDLLKEKGLEVQPDVVVLEFFWNDLYPKPVHILPMARRYTGEAPLLHYVRWLKRSRVLSYLRERFELVWFWMFPPFDWRHQQMIYEGRTSAYVEQAYADVAASLSEFKQLGNRHGFVPILIVFPMPEQVRRSDPLTHLQRRMASIAANLRLPVINLLETMQHAYAGKHDLYISWDNTHLSPRGHEVVAAIVERYLDDSHLLPAHVDGRVHAHGGHGPRAIGDRSERGDALVARPLSTP